MILTDKILDEYPKLRRNKNIWFFVFEVYGDLQTKFEIKKINETYLIYVHQNYLQRGIWQNTILLGVVETTVDLEDIFLNVTRGEYL
jgi:hypothetical protein